MKCNWKINWKARLHNVLFIGQIAAAVLLPVLAYFGLNWEDMTTWAALWGVLADAIQNPVVVVGIVVSLANAIPDPTTPGVGDSNRALKRDKPGED